MTATPPPTGAAPRSRFALTGRTVPLDPLTHAVRSDLADVRLARFVFAPRYAAPLLLHLVRPSALRVARDRGSDTLADLPAGAAFEVLEIAGDHAWGVAPAPGLVGYLDCAVLDDPV